MNLAALGRAASSKTWRRAAGLVLASFVCAGLTVAAIDNVSVLTRTNQLVQDWEIAGVFAPSEPQDPDIVIVAIDEPTLQEFKYRSPVDRKFLSDLLQSLAAHRPRVIGLDILIDQPTEPDKDEALRRTLAGLQVPLIASYVALDKTELPEQLAFENAMLPLKMRGFADLPRDQFDTARTIFPGAKAPDGSYVPGFARAIAAMAGVQTPAIEVPIVWHGHPTKTALDSEDPKPFRQVSAAFAGLMQDSWFRNKIVLIGSDVTLVDRHRTPFSILPNVNAAGPEKDGQTAGIVIQAHGISQLLHGRASPLVSWPINLAIAFVLALLGAALGNSNSSLWLRVGLVAALAVLFWVGSVALFHSSGIVVGLIAPPLAMAVAFTAIDLLGGRAARHERKFIQGAMARYVSPKLVEQMVEDPQLLSLKGERRLMTYLFTDIQDFTTMSEKMDSKDLTVLLNAYLDGMTGIVLKHHGMVDKFIGDSVFAIFNAPLEVPDHAQKAVECMLALDRFTEKFRREQNHQGFSLGVTRIGVHTGAAVIGNFGSQARFTYTAQGDAVNTASRLEGINKYFGTRLCVSDATRVLCRDIAFRPIASVILKGKSEALDLWEPLHKGAMTPEFLAAYGVAYDRLKAGEPDAAALFSALAAENPDDPCTRLHVERLGEGETGVKMVMTEK